MAKITRCLLTKQPFSGTMEPAADRPAHARTRKLFPVPGNVTRKETIFYAYATATEQKASDGERVLGWRG